ncbi:putative SLC26A/SulP transporter [Helianthus annuus]|nr:putative SLC26A/SulP transporter [Helianthus annuus]KAJ0888502.1 putative SLC26A/SulP transporter [Helianthus annuus]
MSGRIAADIEMKDFGVRNISILGVDEVPYVHKVGKPQKQDLLNEIITVLKETFLSDDPLNPFKNQPKKKRFILALQAFFPILKWGRDYCSSKFKGDLIAGCTIVSLCIPNEDIGYAKLADLKPQYRLCKLPS